MNSSSRDRNILEIVAMDVVCQQALPRAITQAPEEKGSKSLGHNGQGKCQILDFAFSENQVTVGQGCVCVCIAAPEVLPLKLRLKLAVYKPVQPRS